MKIILALLLVATSATASTPPPALFLASPDGATTLRTCWYDAGAICSLVRDGVQHIDDWDHGRQLQSDVSFDGLGENNNPTEAGASYLTDGSNPHPSSSVLLAGDVTDGVLSTTSMMANWNPVNGKRVSGVMFQKRVQFISPSVIKYEVAYTIPSTETHTAATFETLTAYMPPTFSQFWCIDVKARSPMPQPLSDGPGEQEYPVILTTADHKHAMGIYNREPVGYGRWRFLADRVVKWNSVVRQAYPIGTFRTTNYVIVGTFDSVVADMVALAAQVAP